MGGPANGTYIVQGEVNLVVTAMRRNSRWATHTHHDDDQDPLLNSFSQLKDILNTITALDEVAPNEFLGPFLEVIRSEDTTGPITGLALTSVNKILQYGLIDPKSDTAAAAIENIADAVTHARFVGTDQSTDEVVLMKILHVLRTLMLTPAGAMLTNESVCEIMQSCFRICFEMRLSELLRRSAENTLMDMVQLLFSRLPHFKEDPKWATSLKKLKMRTGGMDPSRKYKKKSPKHKHKKQSKHSDQPQEQHEADLCEQSEPQPIHAPLQMAASDTSDTPGTTPPTGNAPPHPPHSLPTPPLSGVTSPEEDDADATAADLELVGGDIIATTPMGDSRTVVDMQEGFQEESASSIQEQDEEQGYNGGLSKSELELDKSGTISDYEGSETTQSAAEQSDGASVHEAEYVNPRGVRFTPQTHSHGPDGGGPLVPYGLPCVRELFRFLISLTNPLDRHNTDVMIHMGLSLITVALESGADAITSYTSLMVLVKDDILKNLFFLLSSERLTLFAASIRVCFLLFEAMRSHLKLQMEMYITKLMDIIVSDSVRVSYEQREIALESIVQLLRIPGLVTEIYLNYDCDLYCSNLFEELMKLLSKNAFPVSGLFNTHLLSLDALLAVIDSIEQHCHHRILHTNKQQQQQAADKTQTEGVENLAASTNTEEEVSGLPAPAASGYTVAEALQEEQNNQNAEGNNGKDSSSKPRIRPNRMKVAGSCPSEDELAAIKHKKKVYHTGTEQFNVKPAKGIAYLQENGLLSVPLDPSQVAQFLRENPKLDKKQIGEYIASKKNEPVLQAFQRSFQFEESRVDEALRMLLEAFRLPGEAPVISYILEHFAEYWQAANGNPFANADAAFTLAYAVIMLNVDQHNTNAKKQNIPMTPMFLQALCSGMVEVEAARDSEIVMPSEQTGLVKENYLWKVLLRRGATKEGVFVHVPTGTYDRDLFTLVWGPAVAALSFVFDKSLDETIIFKAISGFRKFAMISAHYGISDVFDNLVISLCKFTTLLSAGESAEYLSIQFGNNGKAQMAAKTVFALAHRHGDILREGWKNILDCLLQLYRAKMLPEVLVTVEDFLDPSGRISLVKEEKVMTRTDSGVLSSFYSYFTSSEPAPQRAPSAEDQRASKKAQQCIEECHVEQIVQDSKFLRLDSLHELIKALMSACRQYDSQEPGSGADGEDGAVFFLELLIKVVLQNRDRVGPFWQSVRDHLYNLVVNADEPTLLVERAVVGLLRVAIRLLRREDIAPQVLASLRILLMMKPRVIHAVSRQISYGLHDLLKTNAANIHSQQDWFTLFTLLEVVGAGTDPPPLMQVGVTNITESISDAGAQSDSEVSSSHTAQTETSDRGYTSDTELHTSKHSSSASAKCSPDDSTLPNASSWQVVNREDLMNGSSGGGGGGGGSGKTPPASSPQQQQLQNPINQFTIALTEELKYHDSRALLKCCETLAFLVRDAAHVTPHNFESCVHCLRTFIEASINGGPLANLLSPSSRDPASQSNPREQRRQKKAKKAAAAAGANTNDGNMHNSADPGRGGMKNSKSMPANLKDAGAESDDKDPKSDGYQTISIQLLDLMHTLHTRAAKIFSSWAAEDEEQAIVDAGASALWIKCWCPLLQGIARLCCDTRKEVRGQAFTYLQRALLVHDLQTLSAVEWENCFNKVLFPLLHKLLDNINPFDPIDTEEARVRGSTLLCKVYLQHLTPLISLSTFTALWLTILEFMDKYMRVDQSGLLCESVPESLKNMLLVMHTAGILSNGSDDSQLWRLTWDRIDSLLPHLREELFKPCEIEPKRSAMDREATPAEEAPPSYTESPSKSPPPPAPSSPPAAAATVQSAPASTSSSPVHSRPDSPAAPTLQPPVSGGMYISLHPPLPQGSPAPPTLPLLINPDVMLPAVHPIITGTTMQQSERSTTELPSGQ